jgi:rhamnose transport system permease protein
MNALSLNPPRWFRHETVLVALLALVACILALQSDRFLTADNLFNQARLMTEISLIAIGMTFVIVSGGIDLSVGSIFGLVAVLVGVMWRSWGLPLPLAMVLAVAGGGVAGWFNGFVITRFRVPALITTLATLMLYRGLAEGISQGRSVRGYPEWFLDLAQGELLGVPHQFWLLCICASTAAVILGWTTFGRAVYVTGSNETAAWFSAIDIHRSKLWIYTASGLLSALAAIIFVSRVSTTRSDMGTGMELEAITAVVLGGASIFGGSGTVIGTVLGLVLMQALKNGLSLAGVQGNGTIVVIGFVLIGTSVISSSCSREHT